MSSAHWRCRCGWPSTRSYERQGWLSPSCLLDDVFSELDPGRAEALLDALPGGQRLLTTAAWLPPAATPDRVLKVFEGTIAEVSGPEATGRA